MIRRWLTRIDDYIATSDNEDVRINCPFCKSRVGEEDTKRHLYVSIVSPLAHCFRCEWAGTHVGLIMSVEGCSYSEALRYIENPPADITRFDKLYSSRGLINANELMERPGGWQPLYPFDPGKRCSREKRAIYKYLLRRNVPELDVFGWIPGTSRAWILIDSHWWQGRSIVGWEPKYVSPPWPIGDSLWNADALTRFDEVVICEGVFSALAVGEHAIAICGKSLKGMQAERIVESRVPKITFMFDSDAHASMEHAVELLLSKGYAGDVDLHYLESGDPADGLTGMTVPYSWGAKVVRRLDSVAV